MNNDADDDTYGWGYHSRAYKDHAGDAQWLMREALLRGVDIRDHSRGAGTELVDVLNMLSDALGYDTYSELWLGWDS
jgi:hypothetical protein